MVEFVKLNASMTLLPLIRICFTRQNELYSQFSHI
jgi:hypothetical protein